MGDKGETRHSSDEEYMRSRVAEQVRREKRQQSEIERHLQRSLLYWLKEQVEQLQKETSEK